MNGDAVTDTDLLEPVDYDRIVELEADLRRANIVCENLAARVGALIAENIGLLVRLNEQATP